MEHYTKIDMAAWPRREHYRYYTQTLKVEFNMTAPVNVKNLLGFCRANGYRFYPAAIYCVTRTLGRIENFRMFRNADGELCVWDRVVPNYTIFHADDCTFSDCWTDFSDDSRHVLPCGHGGYADLRRQSRHQGEAGSAVELLLRFLHAVGLVHRLRQPRDGQQPGLSFPLS